MDLLLGIDIGTTSVKAGVFSVAGECLAVAHQDYALNTPAVDQVEIDEDGALGTLAGDVGDDNRAICGPCASVILLHPER